MAHALYIWEGKAYDGELSLSRYGSPPAGTTPDCMISFEPDPKVLYHLQNDLGDFYTTDPIEVYLKSSGHPETKVAVLPIVS